MVVARWAMLGLLAVFVALSALTSAFIPYHDTDALYYGEWSRRLDRAGDSAFPGIPDPFYHRPLFYVGQGWIWHLFGFHERLGRLWAFCFGALLIWAVVRLAAGGLSRAGERIAARGRSPVSC